MQYNRPSYFALKENHILCKYQNWFEVKEFYHKNYSCTNKNCGFFSAWFQTIYTFCQTQTLNIASHKQIYTIRQACHADEQLKVLPRGKELLQQYSNAIVHKHKEITTYILDQEIQNNNPNPVWAGNKGFLNRIRMQVTGNHEACLSMTRDFWHCPQNEISPLPCACHLYIYLNTYTYPSDSNSLIWSKRATLCTETNQSGPSALQCKQIFRKKNSPIRLSIPPKGGGHLHVLYLFKTSLTSAE